MKTREITETEFERTKCFMIVMPDLLKQLQSTDTHTHTQNRHTHMGRHTGVLPAHISVPLPCDQVRHTHTHTYTHTSPLTYGSAYSCYSVSRLCALTLLLGYT